MQLWFCFKGYRLQMITTISPSAAFIHFKLTVLVLQAVDCRFRQHGNIMASSARKLVTNESVKLQ